MLPNSIGGARTFLKRLGLQSDRTMTQEVIASMTSARYRPAMATTTAGVGPLLKTWRSHRRMSQLALATAANVSQRHLSFVESGRSQPSRELLLHLARTLDVPLRDQNTLLTAAGYAATYTERDYDDPELAPLRAAVDALLSGVEPFPAMAIDRYWNVRQLNQGAVALFASIIGDDAPMSDPPNLLRLTFHPLGVRSSIANFDQIAAVLLERIEREALAAPADEAFHALVAEVLAYPGVADIDRRPAIEARPEVSVPLEIDMANGRLRFFTTIATVGAPMDITTEELSVEFYFPADDETRARLVALGPSAWPM